MNWISGRHGLLLAISLGFFAHEVGAQARGRLFTDGARVEQHSEGGRSGELQAGSVAELDAWLGRLVGHFELRGTVTQAVSVGTRTNRGFRGPMECQRIGSGPGTHCVMRTSWPPILRFGEGGGAGYPENSEAYNALNPAVMIFAIDPGSRLLQLMLVDDHGIAEHWSGVLDDETVTFAPEVLSVAKPLCWGDLYQRQSPPHCLRTIRMVARPGSQRVNVEMGWPAGGGTFIQFSLLRRTTSQDGAPLAAEGTGEFESELPVSANRPVQDIASGDPEKAPAATGPSGVAGSVPSPADLPQVQRMTWQLAGAGNADAQFQIGSWYGRGEVLPQDHEQAVLWWRKAAEQGHAEAQNELGNAYSEGLGVPQDPELAFAWCLKAAEQGLGAAQVNLGILYMNGLGVRKDEAQGVAWFRKAAVQGLGWAQLFLGDAYVQGRGVRGDFRLAFEWYQRAAEQGYTDAAYALGVQYQTGIGVEKDPARAVYWLAMAARQGNEGAARRLEFAISYLERRRLRAGAVIRRAPDASSPEIGTTNEGDFAYEIGRTAEWVEVYIRTGHLVGYVTDAGSSAHR